MFFFFLIQFFYLIKDMSLRKKFLSKLFLYLLIGCEFRKSNHWIVCSYYKLHAIVKFQENQILINSSTFEEILHINITFYRFEITIHYKLLNISNEMWYTMLCMLEWMRKRKHRIGALWTRGLRGSALTAYIHGGIP